MGVRDRVLTHLRNLLATSAVAAFGVCPAVDTDKTDTDDPDAKPPVVKPEPPVEPPVVCDPLPPPPMPPADEVKPKKK